MICPQCERPLKEDGERFCSWCRFPVMIVAGKYRLVKKLGAGGVGEVYLAEQLGAAKDTHCVIKFIKEEFLTTDAVVKRFRREVAVTAMLAGKSAHIIRVNDEVGEADGFGYFYTMEHIDGESLRSTLQREGPLSGERVLSIFGQLCEVLATIHDEGVVHRDLKPENIMLSRPEVGGDFVTLIDFGLTKSLVGSVETALTLGGLGTPAYMSPEQCTNGEIDARTDIYALGIILYELLSGRLPFEESSQGGMAALAAHVMTDPLLLRASAPHMGFSAALEAVVMRALEKDPAARFQDTRAFLEAIQPLARELDGVVAQETSPTLVSGEGVVFETAHTLPPAIAFVTPDEAARLTPASSLGEMKTVMPDVRPDDARSSDTLQGFPWKVLWIGFSLATLVFLGIGGWWYQRVKSSLKERNVVRVVVQGRPSVAPMDPSTKGAHRPVQPHVVVRRVVVVNDGPPAVKVILPDKRGAKKPRHTRRHRSSRLISTTRPTKATSAPASRLVRKPTHPDWMLTPDMQMARHVIATYESSKETKHLPAAMKASLKLIEGHEKARSPVAKRLQAYFYAARLFQTLRERLPSRSKSFRLAMSRTWFQIADIGFQGLRQYKVTANEPKAHKAQFAALQKGSKDIIETLKKASELTVGRHAMCLQARMGDVYFYEAKQVSFSLKQLKKIKWGLLEQVRWRLYLVALRRKLMKRSGRHYRSAMRTTGLRRKQELPCYQHAKARLQKLLQLR